MDRTIKRDTVATHDYVNMCLDRYIPPVKSEKILNGKNQWPFGLNICIVFDVSGSTCNSGSNGRRCINRDEPVESESTPKTKMIIFAELEGVAHFLCNLMENFDLSGVNLVIKSFSDIYFDCYQQTIQSNDQLYDSVIKNLDHLVIYQGAGTNLFAVIENVFKLYHEEFYMILATDGQSDFNDQTISFLEKTDIPFNLVVIGAGSIQENISLRFFLMTRNDNGMMENRVVKEKDEQQDEPAISPNYNSECDISYCQTLVKFSKNHGLYIGAYGDYADINEISQKYVSVIMEKNEITDLKFVVHLDNSVISIPENISQALTKNNFVVASIKIGNSYDHYLYTYVPSEVHENNQYAIASLDFLAPGECISVTPTMDFSKMIDGYISNLNPLSFRKSDSSVFNVSLSTTFVGNKKLLRQRVIAPTVCVK